MDGYRSFLFVLFCFVSSPATHTPPCLYLEYITFSSKVLYITFSSKVLPSSSHEGSQRQLTQQWH